MINGVSSTNSSASSAAATTTSNKGTDALSQEQTFLKLLVAQMQNQDPMNPMDGTQYMSQLTSYSQLEQLMGIKSGIDDLINLANGVDTATAA